MYVHTHVCVRSEAANAAERMFVHVVAPVFSRTFESARERECYVYVCIHINIYIYIYTCMCPLICVYSYELIDVLFMSSNA